MNFDRIFNIGLPKTATHSLTEALNLLGIPALHNPEDLRTESLAGRYRFSRDDWRALTNFCEHFYPQLDEAYPNSKFILTVRDKEPWLDSWERQVDKGERSARRTLVDRLRDYSPSDVLAAVRRRISPEVVATPRLARIEVFGCYEFNRSRASYVYDLHYDNALRYFADRPDDLLVMDIPAGDGWEKLCPFLGVDAPDAPFPHRYVKAAS